MMEEGDGGIGADCAVGTIVWVRRRNGSWWPGRILGPEELSASHLMSPRSGTPVKLLGREDASVDWYNLEKSKRVKAFRCGEFDACIERAEASHGIPIKKREKYARREDAILHALELEKQQLEMKHGTVSNGIGTKSSGAQRRLLNCISSNIYTRDNDPGVDSKLPNKKSLLFSKKVVLLQEEESVHLGKPSKQSGWEEEIPKTLPRMRGLQDFGLKIAPTKKKLSQSVAWEACRKPLEVQLTGLSSMGHMACDTSHKSFLAIKGNRSQDGHGEDSFVKKRDRRRPLQQVLQSSAKLPINSLQSEFDTGGNSMQGERDHVGTICRAKRSSCVYLPSDSNDSIDTNGYFYEDMPSTRTQFGTGNILDYPGPLSEECSSSSELAEETESDSSETDYLKPDMEEDGNLMADATREAVPGSKVCESPAAQASENFRGLNGDEMPLPGYLSSLHPQAHLMDASADSGVSKWHMKGKRNIRTMTKRPADLMNGGIFFSNNTDKCNGSTKGASGSTGGSFKMRQPVLSNQRPAAQSFHVKKEPLYHDEDMIEKDLGYSNQRHPSAFQGIKDRRRSQIGFNDSDNDSHLLSPSTSHMILKRPYCEDSGEQFDLEYADGFSGEMEPMLIDVDIKVQNPSHQGEHVPFVSLMSRFNGKQILGHPVQIEILQDGSSSHLVSKYDISLEPAFGRTAKRSAKHRIPRANPAASALGDDDDAYLYDSDQEFKPSSKKTHAGYFSNQARSAKKSISQARRPLVPGKFQKKPLKRVSVSSQKTRMLSSLATESGSMRIRRRSDLLDGLIKPEGGVPLVTCVPVKVVFSRILESIGRPSSLSAHRARMANSASRGTS